MAKRFQYDAAFDSEHLYQSLIEAAPDGMLAIDATGNIVFVNQRAEALFNYEKGDLQGKAIEILVPESLRAIHVQHRENYVKAPRTRLMGANQVLWGRRRNGSTFPVEISLSPVNTPQGPLFAAMVRDISERFTLDESLKLNSRILEVMSEGVALIRVTDKTIAYANAKFDEIYNYSQGELLGQSAKILFSHNEAANQAFPPFDDGAFEVQSLKKGGIPFWSRVNSTIYDHPKFGKVYVTVHQDITLSKLAALALQKQSKDLARSNADLEQFAYMTSHDLREPLRMIASYVELLTLRYKDRLDDSAQTYVKYIVDAVTRMDRLISDILSYSRVGRGEFEIKNVELSEPLEAALKALEVKIKESKATIQIDPLPRVRANPLLIAQVFQNLIDNAIKFRKPDRLPQIHISCQHTDFFWEISVADNGIGIDPLYSQKLFELFELFQRLNAPKAVSGSGIGLALCKKIVERHGGQIKMESKLGHGTVFTFSIPTTEKLGTPYAQ